MQDVQPSIKFRRMERIRTDLTILKWMVAMALAGVVALLLKAFS